MKTFIALVSAFAAPLAVAHNLWIEPTEGGSVQALYGEPEIRLVERSPGKLDDLLITRVEHAKSPDSQPLTWRRDSGSFVLPGAKRDAGTLVEARSAAVRRNAASGVGTHARYYARRAAWPLASSTPAMTLDIVPTAEPNTFAVHFNGAPLTNGTLKVIAPNLWLQVHDIDERGLVRIHTPWRGQYVLDVEKQEQRPGELGGQRYDDVVHRATLTFTTPNGLSFEKPLPAQYRAN